MYCSSEPLDKRLLSLFISLEDFYEDFLILSIKDEFKEKIIREFVGLNSKMYSLIAVDEGVIKKAKGVNKNVVKNIRHEIHIDILFNKKMIRYKRKRIQSKLHRIETYNVCEISLPCFDGKRYVLGDVINSLFSQRYQKAIIMYQSVVYILREQGQFFYFNYIFTKNK